MNNPKVYITVGTTSSGKSIWAKKMAKEKGWKIISGDDLRQMTYGEYLYKPEFERPLKQAALVMANDWNRLFSQDVIIDDAVWFLLEEDRKAVFLFLPPKNVMWVCFPSPTDSEVWERRVTDGRGISPDDWVRIAKEHRACLAYPTGTNVIWPSHNE